jgi:peptidoglycan/LPS O-acetylase OafA/YrhL
VVLFFMISGFIITHVARRESQRDFALKRVLRIYPPLIASILLIIAITVVRGGELLSWKQYLFSFTLLNYIRAPGYVVNGVAWTLVIEMLFYACIFAVIPLLKKRPALASSAIIVLIALVIWQARSFGGSFFLFAASMAYVPFLVQGQLIYLRWAKRISVPQYVVLASAGYIVTIYGIRSIHTAYLPASNSYMVSFSYAFAAFVIGLLLEGFIRVPRFLRFTAEISYSLYLFHGIVGFLVLDIVAPDLNLTLSIALASIAAYAVAFVSYKFVEQPSQALARRMLKNRVVPDKTIDSAERPGPT